MEISRPLSDVLRSASLGWRYLREYPAGSALFPRLKLPLDNTRAGMVGYAQRMSKERSSQPNQASPEQQPLSLEEIAAQVSVLAEAVRQLGAADLPTEEPQEEPIGEEVDEMAENDDSIIVKAGSKTYFFDLKQTRDNKPYLLLTESRYKGDDKERERISITVFPESAGPFGQAVGFLQL